MSEFNRRELPALLQWASKRQRLFIELLSDDSLTWAEVERISGASNGNIRRTLKSLKRKAVKQGYIPNHGMGEPLPDGVELERATVQRGPDGEIERTWTKAKTQKEQQVSILLEHLESGNHSFKRFKPTKPPKHTDSDLLSLLTITDFHLGMYAWEAETGEDWDCDIARSVFLNAVHDAVQAAPKSGTGVLCQLGDFLHWDGLLAITPMSGHVLDSDTRYGKLVDLTISVMDEAVRMMLKRFENVIVIQAEGNHDMSGSVWLRKHIKHMFESEPRVEVDDSEFPYYAHLHGETMLGFHHGHKMKLGQLHKLFASEQRFREMWGKARQTYIHAGHLHHEKVIEDGGAIAEQHPTLAARDAYAARGGWVSNRGAKVITYHKTEGEIHRVTVRPRE